ncbi:pyridine nucleotide-disulfide oxidoreductase [Paenibacillus sp. FSL H8-0548]|uniref:NAD(P)/FAD-dependent oxidoreductase n=1 Tax=Paenibacillus sp. FSL H8-0548 TaxID=1920422 RepID=UPI00096DD69A|nr:NAD(P)/FAD-dependent oxidoreductase [Paenibacillus sp. FSL H8-0548]OMF37606.1 pyridine nucleotide-disulfide oxidoreductase [Paenibacillus sp. FSL H8-0548]
MLYDCVIIGGGPAGLNAALVLGRARRSVVLIDNNQPRNAVTHASHGFLTRDGVTPGEFRGIAYEEVLRYPSVEHWQVEAASVIKTESGFKVTMQSGEHVQARKVILATGLKEVFPEIEGFYALYGKSLFNCPYCDGWELRDQPLVIVSESPMIFHFVKVVYNWSKDLIVCTNGHATLTNDQKELLLSKGITIREEPISAFIGQNGMLEQVRFTDGTQIERTGGFVSPSFLPKALFGESLGCALTEIGGIKTDDFGRSTIHGLYAAGDASYFMPSQLIYAAADGSKAAVGVNMDLIDEQFGL